MLSPDLNVNFFGIKTKRAFSTFVIACVLAFFGCLECSLNFSGIFLSYTMSLSAEQFFTVKIVKLLSLCVWFHNFTFRKTSDFANLIYTWLKQFSTNVIIKLISGFDRTLRFWFFFHFVFLFFHSNTLDILLRYVFLEIWPSRIITV